MFMSRTWGKHIIRTAIALSVWVNWNQLFRMLQLRIAVRQTSTSNSPSEVTSLRQSFDASKKNLTYAFVRLLIEVIHQIELHL